MKTGTSKITTSRRMIIRTGVLIALLTGAGPHLSAADCKCGPLYCKDGDGYAKALAEKKAQLLKEYPPRLVAILDKVRKCEGCIRTGPDGFSMMRVALNGDKAIDSWDKQNEINGAKAVTSGALKQCFVIYVRKACSCVDEEAACGVSQYAKRKDYNSALDLNMDMAIPCSSTG